MLSTMPRVWPVIKTDRLYKNSSSDLEKWIRTLLLSTPIATAESGHKSETLKTSLAFLQRLSRNPEMPRNKGGDSTITMSGEPIFHMPNANEETTNENNLVGVGRTFSFRLHKSRCE